MQIVFLIVSPLFAILSGIIFTAALSIPTKPAKLISSFIISFSSIALIAEILGSTFALSNQMLWLVLQTVILALVSFIWWRSGKPSLGLHVLVPTRGDISRSLRKYPVLWALGAIAFLAYLVGAWLILYVPPNNFDGMTYHLARVGYWLQFDSFSPWETTNTRQVILPANAEIAVLWTVLLRGTDQLAGFVQWICAMISSLAIFGMGRVLGFTRAQSAFPALIFLTLSEVYLQSTTVQNDLVMGAAFVSVLYLLLLGLKTLHYRTLLISGIAVGLCVGTKSTAAYILPGLACAALLLWLRNPRGQFKLFFVWGSACLVSILIWGVYIYVLNLAAFGYPLGPQDFVEDINASSEQVGNIFKLGIPFHQTNYSRLELLAVNAPRYLTNLLDFSSLGDVGQELTRAKYEFFDRIFGNTIVAEAWTTGNWDWLTSKTVWWGPHEDTSWFGLLGVLLYVPGLGYGVYLSIKRRDVTPLCLVLIPLIFLITQSISQRYTPAKGRYYVTAITASAVLMIWPMVSSRPIWRSTRVLIVFIVAVTTVMNILLNGTKPLVGPESVLGQSRLEKQGGSTLYSFLRAIETFVPADEKIAVVSGGDMWEHPLFGEYFTRYLVPVRVTSGQAISLEELRYRQPVFYLDQREISIPSEPTDYILIDGNVLRNIHLDTHGFELIANWFGTYLYRSFNAVYDTESDSIRYEFDGITPGSGWHYPAVSEDGNTYQWSSRPNATLGAVRLAAGDAYQVQLRLQYSISEEITNSLHLLANDTVIYMERAGNLFSSFIPNEVIEREDGLLRLEVRTDRVISPYREGINQDPRLLGVAVDWFTIDSITVGNSVRAEFDGVYSTNGFYTPEGQDLSFQWTGEATNAITIPMKVDSDLFVQFWVTGEVTPNSLESLVLTVDDNMVELVRESSEQGTLFTAFVPQFENPDNQITFIFNTVNPVSPSSFDSTNPDTRPLGLAFDWMTIEPFPSLTSARIEFDGRYPVSGWHPTEGTSPDFQWTNSPVAEINILLNVTGDLLLEFSVINVHTPGLMDTLSVYANNQLVEAVPRIEGDSTLFSAVIPQEVVNDQIIRLRFETDAPASPNSLNSSNPDARRLGLAFDWLTLEPYTEGEK